MANESLLPSKFSKHFKTIHSNLPGKSVSYLKRLSEQQAKTVNCFKSVMTVSDKAQIVSYQV